ncbi:hypothetical protein QBC44DRAFT_38367 [Cladorrhinum sp. PSN332]|nr:hypothetical protein QBC44DRAFT_38367 [Cladorrhinum sp. PSN332]
MPVNGQNTYLGTSVVSSQSETMPPSLHVIKMPPGTSITSATRIEAFAFCIKLKPFVTLERSVCLQCELELFQKKNTLLAVEDLPRKKRGVSCSRFCFIIARAAGRSGLAGPSIIHHRRKRGSRIMHRQNVESLLCRYSVKVKPTRPATYNFTLLLSVKSLILALRVFLNIQIGDCQAAQRSPWDLTARQGPFTKKRLYPEKK